MAKTIKPIVPGLSPLDVDNAIYDYLRTKYPNFVFWIRTQYSNDRFKIGYRFPGADHYVSIGLVKTSGGATQCKAIHLNFENSRCFLGIPLDCIENPQHNFCYQKIADTLNGTPFTGKRYRKEYNTINNINDVYAAIDVFIAGDYKIIQSIIAADPDCKDQIWTKTEFDNIINNAQMKRNTQYGPISDSSPERHPLNLILYGPPGTGKTYNTVNEALDIIQPKWREDFISQQNSPEGIKDERDYALDLFNKYKEEGRIVFTTFHQSLSYEEFIEGIKPINGDTSIVIKHNNANTTGTNQFGEGFSTIDDLSMMRYEVKSGIFKDICLKAAQNSQSNYDECYEKFIKDIAEYEYFELQTSKQSKFYVSVNRNNNLKLYTTENKNLNGVLTKENIYATHLGELDYWKGYMQGVLKHLKDKYNFKDSQNEKTAPYVLIIDEINRGNVSQIFGELITLIEEDKRTTKWDKDQKQYVDNPEKITVKLPYSPDEKPFGVPGNLYIIGTMNTADRSVEALDTALRRRFDFKEMMPKPELVKGSICGYALKDILSTINDRIRVLKDREHQIGHSYFMKCKTEEDLINVFKNNIVPLLQEYFYGNYAYIGLVLGDGFVKKEDAKPEFASLDGYTYDSDNEPTYRLLTDDEWETLNMKNALDKLMGNKSDTSENVAENEQLS